MFSPILRALTMCSALLTLVPAASQAATKEQVQRVVEFLKSKESLSGSMDVKEYRLKAGNSAEPDSMASISLVYGVLSNPPDERGAADAEMKRLGLKPLPDTPAFGIVFPVMQLCTAYLIDADLNGTVTHSGMECAAMSGFIGLNTGPGESFFAENGGVQAMYDRILDKALLELR